MSEQNTPTLSDNHKVVTLSEFREIIRRAYQAGAMAERMGKHPVDEKDAIMDTESIKKAFEGFQPELHP